MNQSDPIPGIKFEHVNKGVEIIHADSWRSFSKLVEQRYADGRAMIFRGQANLDWPLLSTWDRLVKQRSPMRINIDGRFDKYPIYPGHSDQHLKAFQELARGVLKANELPDSNQDFNWWAIAQHHGLATPLLDWTYYPYVALYFAFEEELCKNDESKLIKPDSRVVYAASSNILSKTQDKPEAGKVSVFVPGGLCSNRRVAQGGVLMYMPPDQDHQDLEDYVRNNYSDQTYNRNDDSQPLNPAPYAVIHKVIIQCKNSNPDEDERISCLKWLDTAGINRARLFPDLDGAAQSVNNLWELGFDTSIGFLMLDEKPLVKPTTD